MSKEPICVWCLSQTDCACHNRQAVPWEEFRANVNWGLLKEEKDHLYRVLHTPEYEDYRRQNPHEVEWTRNKLQREIDLLSANSPEHN